MRLLLSLLLLLELSIQAQIITTPGGGSGGGGAPGTTIIAAGADLAASINSLANGATLLMGVGTFSIAASNNVGSADPLAAPMRLLNKTNVTIAGSGLGTTWSTSGGGSVFLVISNCQNVTVTGVTMDAGRSGYSSNGVNGVMGAIELAGTNNWITIQNCRFQNLPYFGILCGYRGSLIDSANNLSVLDCSAYNCGLTNGGSVNGSTIDGGLIALNANNAIISRCHVSACVRSVELFPSAIPVTNIVISEMTSDSSYQGISLAGPSSGISVVNCSFIGGTNSPASFIGAVPAQTAFIVGGNQPIGNIVFNGLLVSGARGAAMWINEVGASISNIVINGMVDQNGGVSGVTSGGILIYDNAGGSSLRNVSIRNSVFSANINQAIDIIGGQDIFIENSSFMNVGIGGVEAIRVNGTAFDVCSNIVIRNNLFQNNDGQASRATYAVAIDSGVMNVRFTDNIITNLATGAISDSGGSTTIIGEPFSYSVTTNLASLAAGASTTIFIPAAQARPTSSAAVVIPPTFFAVSGGSDIATAIFCTNSLVTVRIINNGAGAFDPGSEVIRATVRAAAAY